MNDRAAIRNMRSRMPSGLLAGMLLVLLSLLGYQLWLNYRDQVRTAEINTRNLAAIFEARLDATLRRTDADLKALASEIPVEALNQKNVALFEHELNTALDRRLFNLEEMTGYRVHDTNGNTLYTSDRAHVQNVNVSDRAYFRLLRDDRRAGLVFSEVLTKPNTNRQVIVIARALHNEQGSFMGVVHGMLDLEYYRRQFKSLDLGSQGVVALRRSDGHTQVLRSPDPAGDTNKSLASDHPLVSRILGGARIITLYDVVQPDNVSRILSVQVMQNYPFYFAVGVGREEVLAGWRSQVIIVVISTLLLFAMIGMLIVRLGRMRVREAGILTSLAQSESHFSELAQMVPVGICHLDREGAYTYVNDRHLALTGQRSEALLGSHWLGPVHPDDRSRLKSIWERGASSGKPFVCEYRFVRPDGKISYVISDVQPEAGTGGTVSGYIAAQTDITVRKQVEAELLIAKQQAENANIAKTRFLAAASHDLRQPIQAINLFRDALGRTDLNEEQKTISHFLSMSVRSLGELLYSLLDISKLDAGLVKPQLTEVPVEHLFEAIDAEFSTLARQKNLRFKLFYPFKSLVLSTDSGLLLCVLRNLIDNAFKYTELGGVLVGVRKRGGRAILQVWDTGVGIDPQYGEKIFEECFQVGNPLRDRVKGLGIGLSIARRMSRLLNGDVNFRSRPGWGTVFEVLLPLAEVSQAGDADASGSLTKDALARDRAENEDFPLLRGWDVVVIEDEPVVAKSIELSLQSMGMQVTVFGDSKDALDSPDILDADFYISDFMLPGLNGIQLLDAIQQRSATSIQAILMTGETSPERVKLATSSCWRVLFKPAELSRLLTLMNDSAKSGPPTGVGRK